MSTRPAERYAPLYFLASLGAGGLAVTFFMWLMFWVPHPGRPVPIFEDIAAAFGSGTPLMQGMIVAAMAGIAIFAALNLRYLVWNLRQLPGFRRAEGFAAFSSSNAETQLLAMPLALAMSVNVGFILGLVFVPGLWNVVEYLFPLALVAFLAIGVLAFRMIGAFLGRVIGSGGFNCSANNSYAQMLPGFALAMVGVGLAAPAALSASPLLAGISLVTSTFFLAAAGLIVVLALVLGTRSMLENGVASEAAPTLLVLVPILTVAGILMLRQGHGLHVHFDTHASSGDTLMMLTRILSVQALFAVFGLFVLARVGYAARHLFGGQPSPGAYALVCPGVALSVMLHFWLNKGLVAAGLVAQFGAAYWAISAVAVALQVAMIALVVFLNRQHFGRPRTPEAIAAE
jgi:hypothetical protein